jgi:hypothetical protein
VQVRALTDAEFWREVEAGLKTSEGIRVTLVRHHRQHPETAMDRL